jgi:hypothetical protein
MPRRRDPNLLTGYLCRFCGQRITWGTILRLLRVDPDTPDYMLNESYCHTECLAKLLRPGVELTFHRHWMGRVPYLDDSADIYFSSPAKAGAHPSRSPAKAGAQPEQTIRPCAMCGKAIASEALVRLRVQKPAGTVKAPEFDEQTLPLHFECLAEVSTTRFG